MKSNFAENGLVTLEVPIEVSMPLTVAVLVVTGSLVVITALIGETPLTVTPVAVGVSFLDQSLNLGEIKPRIIFLDYFD